MITWTLIMCTKGWLLCGAYRELPYPTEQACITARDDLYKRHGNDAFKYLVCAAKTPQETR